MDDDKCADGKMIEATTQFEINTKTQMVLLFVCLFRPIETPKSSPPPAQWSSEWLSFLRPKTWGPVNKTKRGKLKL